MRDKLDPKIERKEQFHAFEVYRDLGSGRSFRAVARIVQRTPGTICKWAKLYEWKERISQHNTAITKRKETGALMGIDDPVAQRLLDAMNRIEALIDKTFIKEMDGSLSPTIKIKNVEELTRLIAEYRKFLETYHRFVAEHMPKGKEEKRGTVIKEFNLNMGEVSQEERIEMMKGLMNVNATAGDKKSPGGVQEADYTEVSERGDEDGHGCDGVSGSPANSNSGDEETLRES